MEELSVEYKIDNGIGFNVGHDRITRLDRLSDGDIEVTKCCLLGLLGQVQEALRAISIVQDIRYDQDTLRRTGQYALE